MSWKINIVMEDQINPPNKIRKTKITIPYCRKNVLKAWALYGKMLKSIHEPSKGGTGIRLKIANQIFIDTI